METILALGLYERDTLLDVVDADAETIAEIDEVFTEVFYAPTTCPEPTAMACIHIECSGLGGCCVPDTSGTCTIPCPTC